MPRRLSECLSLPPARTQVPEAGPGTPPAVNPLLTASDTTQHTPNLGCKLLKTCKAGRFVANKRACREPCRAHWKTTQPEPVLILRECGPRAAKFPPSFFF